MGNKLKGNFTLFAIREAGWISGFLGNNDGAEFRPSPLGFLDGLRNRRDGLFCPVHTRRYF